MVFAPNQDSFLFFASIFLGFCIGLYYEIFRFLRLAIPHPDFFIVLEDLCFFLPLGPVLIFFHYALNSGVLRWFSLFGSILGFLLYLGTVGKLLLRFSSGILRFIRALFKRLFKILISPFLIVFKNITNYLYEKVKCAVIIVRKKHTEKNLLKDKKKLSRRAEKGFQ